MADVVTPPMPDAPAEEQLVNVLDPDTQQVGSIPISQLPDAMAQGYQQASHQQALEFVKQEKYSTPGQQLAAAAEGAASAATFGLSTAAETGLGISTPEEIEARREVNPGVHGLGQIAGLIAPTGAGSLLGKAGSMAAKAVGLGEATTAAAKIGSAAVKNAVEGALFESGNEVSKAFASTPGNEPNISSALANVGLAGLIGGGIGGAIGSVSPLWDATAGKKLAKLMGGVEGAVAESSELAPDFFSKNLVEQQAGILKPNSREIMEAANRLGIKPTLGTVSGSEFIQKLEGNLARRGTIAGQTQGKELEEVFSGLKKATNETFRDATLKSEYEVGKTIKEGITDKLAAELKPIEAQYDALKPVLKSIPVGQELKQAAANEILSDPIFKIAPDSASAKAANKFAEQLGRVENVDQLKDLRTLVNKQLNAAYRTGAEETGTLQAMKNSLTGLRESAIEAAGAAADVGEAVGLSRKTIDELRAADTSYRGYKQKLKDFGVEAGAGNLNNARQMLERFSKMSDESFASRVFDINDLNQMKFFKENFPEQFELARRYKLKEIMENSVSEAAGRNGELDPGKFLRQISDAKMNPEARAELFAGNAQKIEDIRTLYRAVPGNPNPSGTAHALSFGDLFSPSGIINNASDAVKYALLKSQPYFQQAGSDAEKLALAKYMANTDKGIKTSAFKAMVDFIQDTIKGENAIGKGVKSIFRSTEQVLPSHLVPDDKKLEKLDKKLIALQTDQSPLLNVGGEIPHYLPDHGAAMGQVAASAVNYLNSLRPDLQKKSPLDSDPKESPMQKAAFKNALTIAEQPLVVLKDIQKGTITAQDVVHLKNLYPGLYTKLTDKLTAQMIETVHNGEVIPYKTRMGLSVFMGHALDSTLTPSSIIAMQPQDGTAGMTSQQKDQAKQASMGHGPHSTKNLGKMASSEQTQGQAREAQKIMG